MKTLVSLLCLLCQTAFADSLTTVEDCRFSANPDAGVRVQVLQVANDFPPLLVAVILSNGFIKPYVIASYPVTSVQSRDPRIINYKSKNGFRLSRDQIKGFSRVDDESTGLHVTGTDQCN